MQSQKLAIQKNDFLLWLIIIIEGFVSVAAEILVIRQLIPVVGSSIVVTSLIIGVFLLFLAVGYWRGGFYQENYYGILQRNFILAAAILGIGLAYLFIGLLFESSRALLGLSPFVTLFFYLLVIIAPLVYLFGQTVPITMNLVRQEKLAGTVGGKVLFFSTVGSFFGAILTTLFFMEELGVAWTVVINCELLLFLALLLPTTSRLKTVTLTVALFITLVTCIINIMFERSFFAATTNLANYRVVANFQLPGKASGKLLQINNSASTFLGAHNEAFPYITLIQKILFSDLKLHGETILVLGAGGFSLSAAGTNGNNITYVDIDPKIYAIVKKSFLSQINGEFVNADARVYLQNVHSRYAAIVSDVYSNPRTIPASLLTAEYFMLVRSALKDNGVAIFNIVAKPFLVDSYAKRVDTTMRSVFGNCMVIPLEYVAIPTNIIYVCKKAANEKEQVIYTDDRNSATLDAFE